MSRDPAEREFLLSDMSSVEESTVDMTSEDPALGRFRAYWLGAVICMGGFLFGYDTGIIGGVLTFSSFRNDFGYTESSSTRNESLAVGLQQGGAFIACFLIWPVTHRFGRKKSLILCSMIFCVGAMIQTINTGSLAVFFVARIIAGLGLGGATVVIPMFSSEMAPKELRGQIGCFFQLFFTFGIFTSYWIDYGVSKGVAPGSAQWQIPVSLQLVPGAAIGLGTFTLKESVRWYTRNGLHDKAWESLQWVRGSNGPRVQEEMDEIRHGVKQEMRETEGFRWTELLERRNFGLVSTAFNLFMAQQATGATALAYYGPQYFQLIVGKGEKDLLLTGIFGAVKVVSCASFVWLFSERFGRKTSLVWGAGFMSACLVAVAIVVKTHPPPSEEENPAVNAAGIATVALIYLFVAVYNGTWGPLCWPICSEIFPTRIREPGVAVGVSSQWLFNFIFTLITPYMISNLGWVTFLIWGIFNIVSAAVTHVFLSETRGLSLEEINAKVLDRDRERDDASSIAKLNRRPSSRAAQSGVSGDAGVAGGGTGYRSAGASTASRARSGERLPE